MTRPTDPKDAAGCLALAQRRCGDTSGWAEAQWQDQLADDSVQRGDPPVTCYRPYRTALAYLTSPDRVKTRKEGDVQEDYVDLKATLEQLRELDAEWTAERLPASTTQASGDQFDGTITWGGW